MACLQTLPNALYERWAGALTGVADRLEALNDGEGLVTGRPVLQ